MKQLKDQKLSSKALIDVSFEYEFIFPDNRRCDISNKIESVNDLLVDY